MFRCIFAVLLGCASAHFVNAAESLEREIILVPHPGGEREDREIQRGQERVRTRGESEDLYAQLGWSFVAKARRTSDDGYFTLALATADEMRRKWRDGFQGRALRGHVLHQLHRFAEAEREARILVRDRGAVEDFGLLSDVLMERGNLDEAAVSLQRMLDLKPGAEAFSRIAHLRWLKGDPDGAIAALETARRAVSARDAVTNAWVLARLSSLWLEVGALAAARETAERAAAALPDYAPALFALARAELAEGNNAGGVALLERAVELHRSPEYQWWLADVRRDAGDRVAAKKIEEDLRAHGEAADPRTTALFLATRKETAASALRLARAELANRADVFTRDALAWALHANGEPEAAAIEMRLALREGTRAARLLFHAGEIALANGRGDEALSYFRQAERGLESLTPSERARLHEGISTSATRGWTPSRAPATAILLRN